MQKVFKTKFIFIIIFLFFVFNIKISNAQQATQPCSNFAGAECVQNINLSSFQYEFVQYSVCPDVSDRCVRRLPACTGECKPSSNCLNEIGGFCDGTTNTSCCGSGNMTSTQQSSIEKVLQKKPVCPEGQIYLEVPIRGKKCVANFGEYMTDLYDYFIYLAGVLAVIVIMIGGFQWVSAGGNQSKIGEAKERISGAIIGLILALGSYMILETINPNLLSMRMPRVRNITAVPIKFSTEDHIKARAEALKENIACNSNLECSKYDLICAPKNSNNGNQKICMNQSYDNGQCDEDDDCLQGLKCDTSGFKCVVPDILKCIGQRDLGARCFQSLYPLASGYCTSDNTCTLCKNKNADCSLNTLAGLVPLDVFGDNNSICSDQYNVCGQINKLTPREEFQNLPPAYKQQPEGDCKKSCPEQPFGVVGTVILHVTSYLPVTNQCIFYCK